MAPSTPPPPKSELLAALTIASTWSVVMSARTATSWAGIERRSRVAYTGTIVQYSAAVVRRRLGYSMSMASNKHAATAAAPTAEPAPPARPAKPPDRRLRLEDILKLMVADGLVSAADAELLGRSRTQRFETVLELIADRKWRSLVGSKKPLTLDAIVEWLAARL